MSEVCSLRLFELSNQNSFVVCFTSSLLVSYNKVPQTEWLARASLSRSLEARRLQLGVSTGLWGRW